MFQLLVALVAIALVAGLVLTSLQYLGDTFSQGSLRAGVTSLVVSGQQIAGAAVIYKVDQGGVPATSMDDLTRDGRYLSAPPGGSTFTAGDWEITAGGSLAVIRLVDTAPSRARADHVEICSEVDRLDGANDVFFCEAGAFFYRIDGLIVSGSPTP